jgi:hypothetical protein
MINGNDQEAMLVSETLQCQMKDFPIKYLGMQLALRPLTRNEWQPALDKILACLPSWQRGMISREGRLLLIKAVIAARPLHILLIAEAPVWFLEEINKWARAFFWTAKTEVRGGQCLVSWDQVCQPTCYGGLGVKNLTLQGLALRVRWKWLERTDSSRPWQGLPMIKDDMASEVFQALVQISVGKGSKVLFWKDRWLAGYSVQDIAPLIFEQVSTRRRNARTVQVALAQNRWRDDIHGELSHAAAAEYARLELAIADIDMTRDVEADDVFSWPCSASSIYSAKATYERLHVGSIHMAAAEAIWKNGATVKCKLFMWLTIKDRQWTSERRFRHGLQAHTAACFVCLQEEDSMKHIFTQCVFARQVWYACFQTLGVAAEPPSLTCSLEDWWLRERNKFTAKTRKNFDALVMLGCWCLWKNRNAWVFNNRHMQFSATVLTSRIRDEFSTWVLGRRGRTGVFDPG